MSQKRENKQDWKDDILDFFGKVVLIILILFVLVFILTQLGVSN